jgi:hypothetical protein
MKFMTIFGSAVPLIMGVAVPPCAAPVNVVPVCVDVKVMLPASTRNDGPPAGAAAFVPVEPRVAFDVVVIAPSVIVPVGV